MSTNETKQSSLTNAPQTVSGELVSDNVNKRYSLIPLSKENGSRALPGEIVVDDKTGDVWVRNRTTGEMVCATKEMDELIDDKLDGHMANITYAHFNNRSTYRLYFDMGDGPGCMVRLDSSLSLPEQYAFYRIRSIVENGVYHSVQLTPTTAVATAELPLMDNETYFVEFYNVSRELLSQVMFTAKEAPSLQDSNGNTVSADKVIDRIVLTMNRTHLYLGESLESLLCRVYAVLKDQSLFNVTESAVLAATETTIDVSDSTKSTISLGGLDTTVAGEYTISATYYDSYTRKTFQAENTIIVSEKEYERINDIILVPKPVAVDPNSVYLGAVGYYRDGSSRDITKEVLFNGLSELALSYDPSGTIHEDITITFSPGTASETTMVKNITLYKSNTDSTKQVLIDSRADHMFMMLHRLYGRSDYHFYRVRSIDDLGLYHTPEYIGRGQQTVYVNNASMIPLATGDNVIVEFYSDTYIPGTTDRQFVGVDVLTVIETLENLSSNRGIQF